MAITRKTVALRLRRCSDQQLKDVAANFQHLTAGFSAVDRDGLRLMLLAEAERRGLTKNPKGPQLGRAYLHWPSIYDPRYAICEIDRKRRPLGLPMTKDPKEITCPHCREIANLDNPVRSGHGKYVHTQKESLAHFDPRSFRTKAVSPTKKIIVGCPRGHFKKGACVTGTRVQAVLTAKNPPLGHNCRACKEFCPDGLTPVERCHRYRDVHRVHGALLTRWTQSPSLENQCQFWAPAPQHNPRHPYIYEGTLVDYGGTRTVAPRSLGALLTWAARWGVCLDYDEVAGDMRGARIGARREFQGHGPQLLYITKRVRLGNPLTVAEKTDLYREADEHKADARAHASFTAQAFDLGVASGLEDAALHNPRWKPNFKTWRDFVYFLDTTLIPDLHESESPYAEDFDRLMSMLNGTYGVDLPYIQWLRETLIPDTLESGREGTAHDLQEAVYWLAARDPRIRQHRPNPLTRAEVGHTLHEAKQSLDSGRRALREGEPVQAAYQAGLATGVAQTAARRTTRRIRDSFKQGPLAVYKAAYKVSDAAARQLRSNPHKGDSYGLRPPVPEAKLIGTDALAMEYMDIEKARREGVKDPTRPWRHDFTAKGSSVWGLPDGSVVVTNPKYPLWRSQPNTKTGK